MRRKTYRDRVVNLLHERFGVCGHCGKRKCPGRAEHSVLLGRVSVTDVLRILDAAEKGEQR